MAQKIVALDLKNSHPEGMASSTDMYYANVGNILLRRASSVAAARSLRGSELREIVLKVVLYFEDVICDGGLWRSFVVKHRELYGKPLPFYDVTGEYFADEPHVEDIRLLIWDALTSNDLDDIVHPEEDVIIDLADAFYEVLEDEFEKAPINEDMKSYYETAAFMEDFIETRKVLVWFFTDCFLTKHAMNDGRFLEYNEHFANMFHMMVHDPRAHYASINQVIFKSKVGMLALPPKEWLALLMEANGNAAHAATLRGMEHRDYQLYVMKDIDQERVLLRDVKDEELSIRLDGYQDIASDDLGNLEGCVASFVRFKGEWTPNGMDSWGNYRDSFEKEKERRAHYREGFSKKNFDKLMKQTNGNPLVYLRDGEDVHRFLMDVIGVPKHLMQPSKLDDEKEIVAWVPTCDEGPFFSYGSTSAICDPRNPFYVKDEEGRDSLDLIIDYDISEDTMARYLIEHGFLPDAAFSPIKGKERGRQLVQENMDFIARSFRRSFY